MTTQPPITVKPGEKPPPPEVLAQAIVDIADAAKRLMASRLKEDTIVLLLHDATKLPRRDIKRVLQSLPHLEAMYLKPKAVPKSVRTGYEEARRSR